MDVYFKTASKRRTAGKQSPILIVRCNIKKDEYMHNNFSFGKQPQGQPAVELCSRQGRQGKQPRQPQSMLGSAEPRSRSTTGKERSIQ